MAEAFLQKIAAHIIEQYPKNLQNLFVVVPNRRAGLFLKKYLAAELKKTFFPPQVQAIEDFIFDLSELRKADNVTLQFELYAIHRELAGEQAQSFDQFSSLANILLSDFNEIDLSLVDASDVYRYLSEIKAISLWNMGREPLTPFQQNYLSFYRSLLDYYEKLHLSLEAQNLAYQGMAYRAALSRIRKMEVDFPWETVLFCGFNALSGAEESLIRWFLENGHARIFWDADEFYLNIRNHEAGRFLRKYFSTWSSRCKDFISNNLAAEGKSIQTTGVPRNLAQARYAGQLIRSLMEKDALPDHTAVVLADESLLIPVLNAIPAEVHDMNITMGYPLKLTPLARLLKDILALQKGMEERSNHTIYTGDLQKVLQHTYVRRLFVSEDGTSYNTKFSRVIQHIRNSHVVFHQPADLKAYFSDSDKHLLDFFTHALLPWPSSVEGLMSLASVLETLKSVNPPDEPRGQLENEYLFQFSKIMKKLREYAERYEFITSVKTLAGLFSDITDQHQVPFYGEPLKGLQIMGMLETRALDFENIILLSANENILPSGNRHNTFIPFDVKKEKGIRTHHDRDAVYSYHFYRLLQRAKHIHILYNTESDDFGSGEKSRFISQLEYELPAANPSIKIGSNVLQIPPELGSSEPEIAVQKSQDIINILAERAAEGFSASSLSTFINCPLQFYFRYIAKIREREELEETIESQTLGSVVHEALSEFYGRFKGRSPAVEELKISEAEAETMIRQAFDKHYRGGQLNSGINLLLFRLSLIWFRDFIRHEQELLQAGKDNQFTILDLEQLFEREYLLSLNGREITFKLKGFIDRIDRTPGGNIRIIDYKTGSVEESKLNKVTINDLFTDPTYKQAFQLMVYTLLCRDKFDQDRQHLKPGIFALRKLSRGFLTLKTENDIPPGEVANSFEEVLRELVGQIFDPSIPFSQTEEIDRCTYCDFKDICTR